MNIDINEIKNRILGKSYEGCPHLTLLPPLVLDNIEYCISQCKKDGVAGDFVETGVWKGGAVIYAYYLYKLLGESRKVYAFDSYEGLPRPSPEYPVDQGDIHWTYEGLKISLEEVKKNFEIFGPLDDDVVFVKGWFKDTMPKNNLTNISVLRLDGDMYESTIDVLEYLYPKLSINGFCIIDDYGHKGAKAAVNDYRAKNGIEEEIKRIDPNPSSYPSSFWRKIK